MIENVSISYRKVPSSLVKDSPSENGRQSIIKELNGMSSVIQEAVDFTKELSEVKMNEVKFWLSTEGEIGLYFVDLL